MRLVRIVGLIGIAALAAMALLGASTASAEKSTVLCLKHTSLDCTNPVPTGKLLHVHLASGVVAKLLSSLATILCLEVGGAPLTGELAIEPNKYMLHTDAGVHKIIYGGCGTSTEHSNCEIEETEGSLLLVLKTGLDEAALEVSSGKTHVVCENVGIFKVTIDCLYSGEGLTFTAGESHLTAEEAAVNVIEGSFFCPNESKLDGLLFALYDLGTELNTKDLDKVYILR